MGCCNESNVFNFPAAQAPYVEDYTVLPNGDTKVIFNDGKFFIVQKVAGITVKTHGINNEGNAFVTFSDDTTVVIPKGLPGEDTIIVTLNPQVINEEFILYYDFDYLLTVVKINDAQIVSSTLSTNNVGAYTGTNNDIVKFVISKTGPLSLVTLKIVKI